MRLSGRGAIVTGAGRGIGRGIAIELATNGARVCVVDVVQDSLQGTVEAIRSTGGNAMEARVDITRDQQVKEMVKRVLDEFQTIDILVNCAGVVRYGKVVDLSEEDWDTVMDVNAKGVFLCCRAVAPHMIRQKHGKIINVASREGRTTHPFISTYAASKAAVILFTQNLALELAPYGINVNSICPGIVWTDMIQEAFQARGWDRRGIPTPEALEKLGLPYLEGIMKPYRARA